HVRLVNLEHMDKYTKGPSYEPARKYWLGDGLVTSVGADWKNQRQMLAPFFTPKAVAQDHSPVFTEDVTWFTERWSGVSRGDDAVDMPSEMATLAASILLKSLFSTTAREVIVELGGSVETMVRYTQGRLSDRLKLPEWMPSRGRDEYNAARRRVDDFILGLIAERRAMPADARPADLLTRMISSEESLTEANRTPRRLRDQCVTMFIAGYETTAKTMSFVWYLLAKHPEIAEALHAEVDGLPPGMSPKELEAAAPFSLAVIKESLRLYPPAAMYVRDVAEPDCIDGYEIPEGALVMLSPYLTHRHPDFWKDPMRFDPGRWSENAERGMHPYAFHPFAAGPRVCIGKNFAYLESQTILVALAQQYAPVLPPGYEPKLRMHGVLGPENGMPMFVKRRRK
ncbi:cytochrome P450, partial [Nocardia tengchongensis]